MTDEYCNCRVGTCEGQDYERCANRHVPQVADLVEKVAKREERIEALERLLTRWMDTETEPEAMQLFIDTGKALGRVPTQGERG